MRKTYILLVCALLTSAAYGQSNYYKLGIGGGAGITQSFTDVKIHGKAQAYYGTLDYFFTPYLSLGLEGQLGKLKGGDRVLDYHKREFTNSYKAATLNAKVYLGALTDKGYQTSALANFFRGAYFGAGVGLLVNNMTDIVRVQPAGGIFTGGYVFPGVNQSKEILLPANLGINFYINDNYGFERFVINVNLQGSMSLGEGMDGYDDTSAIFKNKSPDIYTFASVGLKFRFGPEGYHK